MHHACGTIVRTQIRFHAQGCKYSASRRGTGEALNLQNPTHHWLVRHWPRGIPDRRPAGRAEEIMLKA